MEFVKDNIRHNIKKLRKDYGISQTDFAHKFGLAGKSSICDIEKGRALPTLKMIYEVSIAFHISIDSIIKERL